MCQASEVTEPLTHWDQYPGEDAAWYQLFAYYRDLGIGRQLTTVHAAYNGAYAYGTIVHVAQQWRWAERVQAFDTWVTAERDAKLREIMAQQAEQWAQAQAEMLALATQTARESFAQWLKRLRDGERLTIKETQALFEMINKAQALLAGKPTEILDQRLDLGQLTPEQFAALDTPQVRAALESVAKR